MAVSISAAGASQRSQGAEPLCPPKWPLCESCRNIDIERLSEGRGYTHSWIEVLEKTAKWCRLCLSLSYLFSDRADHWQWDKYKITPHRYKITLSLDFRPSWGRRQVRPDHCHADEFASGCIVVDVFDTRPWQSPRGAHPIMRPNSWMEGKCPKRQPQEVSVLKSVMLCHTQAGDPAMAFGLPWLRNVQYTGSSGSIEVARGWLQQCLATDDECFTKYYADRDTQTIYSDNDDEFGPVTPFPVERPTRLLEIVPSDKDADKPHGHSVKLIETKEDEYKYAALSYCWGKMTLAPITHTWLTQRITIEQYREGIDLGCLPATIRDCIHVAFSLGINYVWVDSLCIIQDDSSDWEAESAKMGGIYRGAHLTIAASRSNSSSSGLFNWKQNSHHLNPFEEYLCIENYLRSGEKSSLYFETSNKGWNSSPGQQLFGLEVYRSPLSQRAWAYQEQMLSRRTLYFAESQLYWECDHCRLSQDNSRQAHTMRETYSIQNFRKPLRRQLLIVRWYCGAVEAYTKRVLTYPKDRMVAISAVAKATYMNRHVRYVAGLWEDCILEGLCWYRDSGGEKDKASDCPSWSWASQLSSVSYREIYYMYEGEEAEDYGKVREKDLSGFGSVPEAIETLRSTFIQFEECSRNEDRHLYFYRAKVLNIQLESSKENPFGQVYSGQIVLRTWATTGKAIRDRSGAFKLHFEGYSGDGERTLGILENNVHNVRTDRAVLDDDGCQDQDVVIAMVIARNEQWLLLLLDKADEKRQTYRRVGLGIMRKRQKKPDFERDWTELDITIV